MKLDNGFPVQERNGLIVEKCEDGHEEDADMVAEFSLKYGRIVRRAIWQS